MTDLECEYTDVCQSARGGLMTKEVGLRVVPQAKNSPRNSFIVLTFLRNVKRNEYVSGLLLFHYIFMGLFSLVVKSTYRVFIKYCVFTKILKYSGLWPFSVFPRSQCVYSTRTRQVEHQRSSRIGRVQKNHKKLRKKHNI